MILERIKEYLRGICVLVSDVVLYRLILTFLTVSMNWELQLAWKVWLVYLSVQLLISDVMMEAGASLNLYLIFNGAAAALGSWLTVRFSGCSHYETEWMILLAVGAVLSGIHCAVAAYHLPQSNGISSYVDALVIVLAFYLYTVLEAGGTENWNLILLTLGAIVLDLTVVNQIRTGTENGDVIQGSGTGGKLILALLFLGCLFVTGMIVGVISGQVHSAVDLVLVGLRCLWGIVSIAGTILGTILSRLLLFLIMLFPSAPPEAKASAQMQLWQDVEKAADTVGVTVPAWVFSFFGLVGAIVFFCWVLYQLRGTKIQRKKRTGRKRKIVRKSHLFGAVRELLIRCFFFVREEWEYFCYRKSVQGLLIFAEKAGRRRKIGRRKNESSGAYMRRLAELANTGANPEKEEQEKQALMMLAQRLDEIYYAAGSGELSKEAYDTYLQYIRSVICGGSF